MATTTTAAPVSSEPEEPAARRARVRVRSTWKSLVLIHVQRLRTELSLVRSGRPLDHADPAVVREVQHLLDDAESAATAKAHVWEHAVALMTGAEIERAWSALHEADELLYLVRSEESVRAKLPELLASVQSRIDSNDPRRAAYETALKAVEGDAQLPAPLADRQAASLLGQAKGTKAASASGAAP